MKMPQPDRELNEAEILIAYVLRIGVVTAGLIIAAGLLSRLFHLGTYVQGSSRLLISQLLSGDRQVPFEPVASPLELLKGALEWRPDVIMTAGLLVLIGLPIVRVALTVGVFFKERDWAFLAITLFVLSVLLSGIFLGRAL